MKRPQLKDKVKAKGKAKRKAKAKKRKHTPHMPEQDRIPPGQTITVVGVKISVDNRLRKLTPQAKGDALQMLAEWAEYKDILEMLKVEHDITITMGSLKAMKYANKKNIVAIREELVSDIYDTPLAHTKYRLDQLQDIMKWALDNDKRGLILDVLKHARDETQGLGPFESTGTVKEAEIFLSSIGVGQINTKRVLRKPESGNTD